MRIHKKDFIFITVYNITCKYNYMVTYTTNDAIVLKCFQVHVTPSILHRNFIS